jgi:hypothetical protein
MKRSKNGIPEGSLMFGEPGVIGKLTSKTHDVVICVGCNNLDKDRAQLQLI